MSLYNNYASKADLVQAYIEARHAEWRQHYQERLRKAATTKCRVLAVFDSSLGHVAFDHQHDFRGCGLHNADVGLSVGDPGRAVVAAQKAETEELMREHLRDLLADDDR